MGEEIGAVFQTKAVQQLVHLLQVFSVAAHALGEDQVFPEGQGLDHGAVLEQEADLLCPEFGLLGIIPPGYILSFKGERTFVRLQQGAHDIQQSRLTNTGRALNRNEVTLVDGQTDILQRCDDLTHPIVLVNMVQITNFHFNLPLPE